MEKLYSSTKPQSVEYEKTKIHNKETGEWSEMTVKRNLNFDIIEATQEELNLLWKERVESMEETAPDWFREENKWRYFQVSFPIGVWSYDKIVSGIIRTKYSESDMEAITNNMNMVVSEFFSTLVSEGVIQATKFLVESANGDSMKQFKEMQEWRHMAKKEAKSIFTNG